MGGEQLGGDARVLGHDLVGRAQHIERPQRYVPQIADGRGDDVQAGRKRVGRRGLGCGHLAVRLFILFMLRKRGRAYRGRVDRRTFRPARVAGSTVWVKD